LIPAYFPAFQKSKVNIFNLAKNVETSVDQIEHLYARNLPLSAELLASGAVLKMRRY
jgi:hypothetical protein